MAASFNSLVEILYNPTLDDARVAELQKTSDAKATVFGTANKATFLCLLFLAGACGSWELIQANTVNHVIQHGFGWLMIVSPFAAWVFMRLAFSKPHHCVYWAPLFTLSLSFFLGPLSGIFDDSFGGLVLESVILTTCLALGVLVTYQIRLFRVNDRFFRAGLGLVNALLLLASINRALSHFLAHRWHLDLAALRLWSILSALAMLVLGLMVLAVDFSIIEDYVEEGATKSFEWYGAFSIVTSIAWIYLVTIYALFRLRKGAV